jgi:hypothetical protein
VLDEREPAADPPLVLGELNMLLVEAPRLNPPCVCASATPPSGNMHAATAPAAISRFNI